MIPSLHMAQDRNDRIPHMLLKLSKDRINLILIVTVLILLVGCSSAYYGTMEKLGYHKRDLMVSRVESARDAQQDAKE
jgi:hypothetical protein